MFREAFIGESRIDCERRWGAHALAVHRLYYNVGVYRKVFEPWVDEVDREAFTFERLAPRALPLRVRAPTSSPTLKTGRTRTGAEWMVLRMRHPGGPRHEETLEAIRRFGAEVDRDVHVAGSVGLVTAGASGLGAGWRACWSTAGARR